jgi:hypothetical protein
MAMCIANDQMIQNDTLFPFDLFLVLPSFPAKPYKNNKLVKYWIPFILESQVPLQMESANKMRFPDPIPTKQSLRKKAHPDADFLSYSGIMYSRGVVTRVGLLAWPPTGQGGNLSGNQLCR